LGLGAGRDRSADGRRLHTVSSASLALLVVVVGLDYHTNRRSICSLFSRKFGRMHFFHLVFLCVHVCAQFQNIDPQSGAARASRLPQPMDRKAQSGAAERGRPRAAGGGGTGAGICCEKCNARLVELKRQALRLYVTSRGLLAHNVTVGARTRGLARPRHLQFAPRPENTRKVYTSFV